MQPRKPTEQERKELLEYLIINRVYEAYQIEEFYKWINAAPVVVFDNYQTDYPGYAGKVLVMLPTYDLYPEIVEIYIWHNSKVIKVTNEQDMERVIKENLDAK